MPRTRGSAAIDDRGETGLGRCSGVAVSVSAGVVELGDSLVRVLIVIVARVITIIELAKITAKRHF